GAGGEGAGGGGGGWPSPPPGAPCTPGPPPPRHYRIKPWSSYMEIHWSGNAQAYVTPIGKEEICVVVMAQAAEDNLFECALTEMPWLKEKLCGARVGSRERGAVSSMRTL